MKVVLFIIFLIIMGLSQYLSPFMAFSVGYLTGGFLVILVYKYLKNKEK